MLGNIIIPDPVYLVHLCYRPLFLAPLIEIDKRQDKKFRQGFIGSLSTTVGSENKQQFPLLACSWAEAWVGPGVRLEGRLRWSAHPLMCRGHVQYPTSASGSLEVTSGFLASLYLLSRICPDCTCLQFTWSHTVWILLPRESCVQAQALQPCSQDPSPRPVSLVLKIRLVLIIPSPPLCLQRFNLFILSFAAWRVDFPLSL